MKLSKADLRREIEQLEHEDQQAQVKELGIEGLAWLALVPAWTEALASASGFPAGTWGLSRFLDEAEARGLCERGDFEYKGEFWIRRGERQPTLSMLKARNGLDFLRQQSFQAAQKIRKTSSSIPVPSPVRRWAELAGQMESSPSQAADWLDQVVFDLLDAGRSGEALGWMDTAAPLAALFGGKLDLSVRLAKRRLELAYRRRQDERHIQGFLRREEQIAAFDHLLENRDGVWALHYLGVGGVGKTMLLRYITARLAPERKLPTGRIDFDYISADYPAGLPGQLLVELVTELLAYGLDRSQLASFTNSVSTLHEALSRDPRVADPLARLKGQQDLWDNVVRDFCGLIATLAEPAHPVVLILDTCEELAKFQPPGSGLPSIEATFFILEDVYRVFQESGGRNDLPFRIVFAGRRPLAQSGFQWSLKPYQAGGKRHLLPEHKSYLDLHELRGFDHRETKQFLCEKKEVTIPTRKIYREILRHSLETGRSADMEKAGFRPTYRRFRYSPFDLALYADWLKAEPNLSAERIAAGAHDPYIQYRILERIRRGRPELEDLLPSLVLLARFDETVLAPLIRKRAGSDFDAVYRELGDQEWIDYQHDEALRTTFLRIDTNLLPRLRAYYGCDPSQEVKEERGLLLERAKRELGPILEDLIEDKGRSLSDLPPDYMDAALRVLPPVEAARLWDRVERRIPSEAGWSWAFESITGRILTEEGAVGNPSHPLWPAVRATLISAQLHLQPRLDVGPLWAEVLGAAPNHPIAPFRDRLRDRALMGSLAARPRPEGLPRLLEVGQSIVERIRAGRDPNAAFEGEQLAAALCAAFANVLDVAEAEEWTLPESARLAEWAQAIKELDSPPDVVAFLHMLAARWSRLSTGADPGKAWVALDRAVELGAAVPAGLSQGRWFDWVPPQDLDARLKLEAVRRFSGGVDSREWQGIFAWRESAVRRGALDNMDRERLIAGALSLELASRPVTRNRLEEMQKVLTSYPAHEPACLAHERTPPLAVALARGYLALGYAQKGLDLLRNQKIPASNRRDERALLAAQMEIVRRMRLQSEISLLDKWINSEDADAAAVAWPAAVLIGFVRGPDLPRPSESATPLSKLHAWYQCQAATEPPPDLEYVMSLLKDPNSGSQATQALAVYLDYCERREADLSLFDPVEWWRRYPGHGEEIFRLALRSHALTGGKYGLPQDLIERIPARRRAEIALEEGELLALRRPDKARSILDRAVEWYGGSEDPVGALISAICTAMTRVREKAQAGEVKDHLDAFARPYYERVAKETARGWPDWTGLQDWRGVPEKQARALLDDPDWGGWMTRLLYCHDYAQGEEGKKQGAGLLERYGVRLPQEMTVGSETPSKPIAAGRKAGRIRDWGRTLSGLGLAAGFFYLAYLGFNSLLGWAGVPATVGTWPRIGLNVAAWIALGLLVQRAPKIVRAIKQAIQSWLAAKTRLSLSFKQDASGPATLHLDALTPRLRWFPPSLEFVPASAQGEASLSEAEDYRTAAALMAPSVVEALKDLRRRLGKRNLDLPLSAPERPLHAPAWEGILAFALGSEGEPPRAPLQSLRVYRRISSSEPPLWWTEVGWRLGLVRVVCSDSAAYAVEKGWSATQSRLMNLPSVQRDRDLEHSLISALPRQETKDETQTTPRVIGEILASRFSAEELRAFCVELSIDPGRFSDALPAMASDLALFLERQKRTSELLFHAQQARPNQVLPYKVLHLVGTPVQRRSDLQWQVASSRDTEAFLSQKAAEGDFDFAGEMLPADELPLRFAPLILLQAEPTPEIRPRAAPDRVRAGEIRSFAHKLVTAGAQAVLTLPPLDFETVPDVVGSISRALNGKSSSDLRQLLAAADEARRAITHRREAEPQPNDMEEMALDVCLFVRSEPELEKEI